MTLKIGKLYQAKETMHFFTVRPAGRHILVSKGCILMFLKAKPTRADFRPGTVKLYFLCGEHRFRTSFVEDVDKWVEEHVVLVL